jgi:hypothetical protein
MKKLLFLATLILIAGTTNGQTLQKGNLIGTHVITMTLNPGITVEKFMDFLNTKMMPEVQKALPDWKCYVVKGIRGENADNYGLIYVVKSQQDRNKYYNPDGSDSELMKQANDKLKSVLDELAKLGTFTTKYTDWEVL